MLTVEAVVRRCSENALDLVKKETLGQVFSCECCEISKNTFSFRTPPVAAPACLHPMSSKLCKCFTGLLT